MYIIMSRWKHGFPWLSLSLAIRLYLPSLPTGLQDYILCPYRAIVDKFLVGQRLHNNVKRSIGECCV